MLGYDSPPLPRDAEISGHPVVSLWLEADQGGVSSALMHVMGDRAHVVEEFAEQVPSTVALHHSRSDEQIARRLHRVLWPVPTDCP